MEVLLGNHSAQSPASVWVASPEHAMGRCKVECGLYCVQQLWWSLHSMLRLGWAGGLWGVRFCQYQTDFLLRRCLALTAHTALQVHEWLLLVMP